jgi:hypothetical protein
MASLSTCMALCFRIHDASGLRMEEHWFILLGLFPMTSITLPCTLSSYEFYSSGRMLHSLSAQTDRPPFSLSHHLSQKGSKFLPTLLRRSSSWLFSFVYSSFRFYQMPIVVGSIDRDTVLLPLFFFGMSLELVLVLFGRVRAAAVVWLLWTYSCLMEGHSTYSGHMRGCVYIFTSCTLMRCCIVYNLSR